jgi:RNA polymerase sigma factor (sigma-70 family)
MMDEMQHEELILAAMPDARKIALGFAKAQARGVIEADELIAIAYSALAEAATRYDGARPFLPFARCRVRGAILDALRAWSMMTEARGKPSSLHQIEREDGTFVVTPFVVFDTARDARALHQAVASLGKRDAAKIRRYAIAETGKGKAGSEEIHREFKMTRGLWQYHRRRILAKLRFELQQRGITKVSDCL